ncbi:MAG: hypothetical protein M3422_10640 [Actinomycetota bacterium]|nr:hypothetical protein [Actinomycetota bacterium]
MRDKRWRKWIVLTVLLAVVGGLLGALAFMPRPAALCDQVDDDDISVNFGLGREPITRGFNLAAPSGSGNADAARQVTATLEGDLVRDGTVATFPADQITVSAKVNSDNRTVDVRAVVDPSGAAAVPEGCYRGHLTVFRNGAEPRRRDVVVDIADREKWSAAVAFVILLIGALVGLTIKWITESLTPLAEARRRFARSRELLANQGYTDNDLPTSLRVLRDDVEQHLRHQEITDLKDKFRRLETIIDISRPAIGIIKHVRDRIEAQGARLGTLWSAGLPVEAADRLASLMESEVNQLNDLRARPWDTDNIAERTKEANSLRNYVDLVDRFISVYPHYHGQAFAESIVNLLNSNNLTSAKRRLDTLSSGGHAEAADTVWKRRNDTRPWPSDIVSPRRKAEPETWLIRHVRLLAALVSALVVTFVGFSVEYLDNQAFEDNMDDWLNLFLWAAVVQLSGVSVLDVVAKLSAQPRLS